MKKTQSGDLIFSPSDLVRYIGSPFASWMDRYYLENPDALCPDEESEDERLVAETGERHEQAVLQGFRAADAGLTEIARGDFASAHKQTLAAMGRRAPIIYQAALVSGRFAGFADFLMLGENGLYQVWDTKLARSPKPYYAIQLCCYSEMLSGMCGVPLPEQFGVILGTQDRVEFRTEDFIYYYRHIKRRFLELQDSFNGLLEDRPEPPPQGEHGRWTSHAEAFFKETDHLIQVANITQGQIRKLKRAGIATMTSLSQGAGVHVPRLAADTLEKLVAQARLQCLTNAERAAAPEAPPRYELLPQSGPNDEPIGIASLPPPHPADVVFDMEGFPLVPGGLEYLFGAVVRTAQDDGCEYLDWWGHDREEERQAFEGFVDWVYARWKANPGMHVYHYAAYEVSAIRRLSTQHDSRQDEVDDLLRHEVFVDLYQVVRHALRIGEDSYSLKSVEHLYRPERLTQVTTAAESMVQYARWIESGQPCDWTGSAILASIRDYNRDDCISTAELLQWLRQVGREHDIEPLVSAAPEPEADTEQPETAPEEVSDLAAELRARGDPVSMVLADLVGFHRREAKPSWWRMFDRIEMTPEEWRDDAECIEGVRAVGEPKQVKRSLVQQYRFDPNQECKLSAGGRSTVVFTHNLGAKFTLDTLDFRAGLLTLKIGASRLNEKMGGVFPRHGTLIPGGPVDTNVIAVALAEVSAKHLGDGLDASTDSLLRRVPPARPLRREGESVLDALIRVTGEMSGGCLVVQGPPGTGKTYAASRAIRALLSAGKRVGITSNSHKAVINLMCACGDAAREVGGALHGLKVAGDEQGRLFDENPGVEYVSGNQDGCGCYTGGVVGGTAWLFTRPEWEGELDYLFIDEAGQVSLANAVATSRCARNMVLLGDQMQLEQPIQGAHPGEANLSALQYALKDLEASKPDAPAFHAVVPPDSGLFLGESHRMHPAVCRFISESIYEGRLSSIPDCARQRIDVPTVQHDLIPVEHGIVFSPVLHEGNTQRSDEEVERVSAILQEMLGRCYTDKHGKTRELGLADFLFVAPYNAQVRALEDALPEGARVGSVDKFQGQEAPVCVLSLCSSYGEYGSRGLDFILDKNRVNVAISRAQCLAVVVADPRIAESPANSLDTMRLINLFCKVVNASETDSAPGKHGVPEEE